MYRLSASALLAQEPEIGPTPDDGVSSAFDISMTGLLADTEDVRDMAASGSGAKMVKSRPVGIVLLSQQSGTAIRRTPSSPLAIEVVNRAVDTSPENLTIVVRAPAISLWLSR